MFLILVRHTERNTEDPLCNTNCDVGISKKGVELAIKNSSELSEFINCENFSIVSSPLNRTIETAEIFKSTLKTKSDIKTNYKIIEGMIWEPYLNDKHILNMKNENIIYPESHENIINRISKFIKNLEDNTIVITHGIIYNYMLKYFFPNYTFVDNKMPDKYFPPYCSITVINTQTKKIEWSNVNIPYA